MMQQSTLGRSRPDRTKACRARIIPTLELHIMRLKKRATLYACRRGAGRMRHSVGRRARG
jgi:hypothetical protein